MGLFRLHGGDVATVLGIIVIGADVVVVSEKVTNGSGCLGCSSFEHDKY